MSSEPWKLFPVNMCQSEEIRHLSQEGMDKLTSLLGQSVETWSFIISVDRAVGLHIELRELSKENLSDTALTNPRNGLYTKVSKCVEKLHETIGTIPERYWSPIEYHLGTIQEGNNGQPDILRLLSELKTATEKAIEEYRPVKAGAERRMDNWALIESLSQEFAHYFPKYEISETKSGHFYKAMTIIFDCKNIHPTDPRDMIRSYLRNSTRV